ncbi:MAG: TlpA disulfide reductase family protein [candidate division WOR-3 bacterium]
MRNLKTGALIMAVTALVFLAAGPTEKEKEYEEAPSFTLKDVTGKAVTLESLLVKGPVYMECWDLPCVNCIAELDALVPVYDSLKDRGLQIVALSVDKPADEARVKAFVKTKKWPYICLLDQQQEVKSAYGIIIKPTAYLINTEGKIVYTHIGYKKGDEKRIKEEFLKWLPEKPVEKDTSGAKKKDD